MQQIADWLKKLGLSEYAQRFAENHVDFSVLPELTDQDLKDLGIVLGDRRKLLRAIADLNGIEKIQSKPTEAATTPVAPQPQDSAERRQVSVMFADLVGSTALSARMDRRTCARSFRPIRDASPRPSVALAGSLRSTWATGSSCTGIPKHMRTTPSGRYELDLNGYRGGQRAEGSCLIANLRWHSHWAGRGRRPDRLG